MQLATFCKTRPWDPGLVLKKLCLLMNLTGFFLLAAVLQVSAAGYSQKVSLNFKNVPVKTVFREIIRQTGISMIYREVEMKKLGNVNVDVKDASVDEVLAICFKKQPVKYRVINNTVIISDLPQAPLVSTVDKNNIPDVSIDVRGRVTDAKGKPMEGVSITTRQGNLGTTTNADGFFSIRLPDEGSVLIFSYVGFVTIEQRVTKSGNLVVIMQLEEQKVDEVVVIGYGTAKRVTTSGAISSINSKELKTISAANAAVALQGRIPGLQIYRGGGPLAGPRYFQLRGVGSLGVNSSPLVLVDGVPGDINSINPQQIEDISILKDATASAVYGASAAGGIILITTKSGKEGKVKVDVTLKQGWNNFVNLLEPLNAREQALLVNEARINADLSPAWSPKQIDSLGNGGTNWIKNVTRTGIVKEANVQISGGGNKSNFLIATNYVKEEGAVVGNWAERGNTRLKLNTNITNWFKVGLNIFGQFTRGRSGADLVSAAEYSSFIPQYLADGRPGIINPSLAGGAAGGQAGGLNPLQGLADSIRGYSNYNPSYNLNNILTGELKITRFLRFNTIFNYGVGFNYVKQYSPDFIVYDARGASNGGAIVAQRKTINRTASSNFAYGYNWGTQNYFTYNDVFNGVHDITAVAGFRSAKGNMGANISATRNDFANNVVQNVGQGSGTGQVAQGSDNNPTTSYSYFGRLSYTYNNKYTIEGSVSYDGSDRFGPKNKFGAFGGVGASWRISQEKFFSDMAGHVINEMKLRGSYGSVGNDRIGQFLYYSAVNISGSAYTFGQPPLAPVGGANQDGDILPNNSVKWETLKSLNLGTDITFLKNWNLTLDWYNRITKNLLFQVPVSLTTGFGTQWQNIGNLSNKGVEISLAYNNNFGKDVTFNSRLIYTRNKNVVTELFNGQTSYPVFDRVFAVGKSVNTIYGWKVLGIYESQDQINASPHFGSPAPGDLIYEDINKDNKINTDDFQPIGDALPKGMFAWTNSITWKNFDFNIHVSADYGAQIAQGGETRFLFAEGIGRNNLHYVVGRWHGPGTSSNIPRLVVGNTYNASGARPVASNSVQNGDYVRIRQIELGYRIPDRLLQKARITSARIFANAINPFTFTKFYGWDPESGSSGQRYSFYPIYRTIMAGINVSF